MPFRPLVFQQRIAVFIHSALIEHLQCADTIVEAQIQKRMLEPRSLRGWMSSGKGDWEGCSRNEKNVVSTIRIFNQWAQSVQDGITRSWSKWGGQTSRGRQCLRAVWVTWLWFCQWSEERASWAGRRGDTSIGEGEGRPPQVPSAC